MMKRYSLLLLTVCLCSLSLSSLVGQPTEALDRKMPKHPRLLWLAGEEKTVRRQVATDVNWAKVHGVVMDECQKMLTLAPNERLVDGRRLLKVSRENLKRIGYLGYAYRMTGDRRYARRAEEEMLKCASFADWNPSHFLDVAEMTLAMALGYDWLYTYLSEISRKTIREAILDKGVKASLIAGKNDWWLTTSNNWNQVCNTGMALGMLAVYEENPRLATEIVNRSIRSIRIPMKQYAPDGAYPEGITYWNYGTTFNLVLINALERLYDSDFGLSDMPGFLPTGLYSQQMITPALQHYNYGDCKPIGTFNPASFWFYSKTKNPALLYIQKQMVERLPSIVDPETQRFLPFALIWGTLSGGSLATPELPTQLVYRADGENPVAVFRSSWDDSQAAYLGFKGGADNLSHAHQDVGSFYFEASGVGWAVELGQEDYTRLEAKGVQVWQDQRWEVFRYNCFNHNQIVLNNKPHRSGVSVPLSPMLVSSDQTSCSADLSDLFTGLAAKVKRRVSLVGRTALIEDELRTYNHFTQATWSMVTEAEQIEIRSAKELLLRKGSKRLRMTVECDVPVRFGTRPAQSEYSFDSPNVGRQILFFRTELPLDQTTRILVSLIPE